MKSVFAALLMLCSLSWAQTTIQKLEVTGHGKDTVVEVTTSAGVSPQVETATNPDRLVLILPGVMANNHQRNVPVNFNGVKDVRVGLNNTRPLITRVVIDLEQKKGYNVSLKGNSIAFTITDNPATAAIVHKPEFEAQVTPPQQEEVPPAASNAPIVKQEEPTTTGAVEPPAPAPVSAPVQQQAPVQAEVTTPPPAQPAPAQPATAGKTTAEQLGYVKGSPVFTGFLGTQAWHTRGNTQGLAQFDPIVIIPIGNRIIVESLAQFDVSGAYSGSNGGVWSGPIHHEALPMLQGDVIVNKYLTVVGGRFLTDFGIYDRQGVLWLRNLMGAPFLAGFVAGDGNGITLKGGAPLGAIDLAYSGYYSAKSMNSVFGSERMYGARLGAYLRDQHLEMGFSYNNTQNNNPLLRNPYDTYSGDLTYNVHGLPLDITAMAVYNKIAGTSFYTEGDYWLKGISHETFFRNSKITIRGEKYWTGQAQFANLFDLPGHNANGVDAGYNYDLSENWRIGSSFEHRWDVTGHNWNAYGLNLNYKWVK